MSDPTLLQIYESFHSGQIVQFCRQVREYGSSDFAKDTKAELAEGVLSTSEAYNMLRTFMMNESDL